MKLEAKSKENLIAAKKLIDSHLHCSSIHCSYYSCFQKIASILIDFYTKEKLDEDIRSTPQRGGIHIQYITKFCSDLKNFISNPAYDISQRTITDFYEKITILKALRVNADYHEDHIDTQKSNTAYTLAEEILKIIKIVQP